MQIALRRQRVLRKRKKCTHIWPIDERAGIQPVGWSGWTDEKRFDLVITHDVDTEKGNEK